MPLHLVATFQGTVGGLSSGAKTGLDMLRVYEFWMRLGGRTVGPMMPIGRRWVADEQWKLLKVLLTQLLLR